MTGASGYAMAAEWFALTPIAPVVEWARFPEKRDVILGLRIAVQFAFATVFWAALFTTLVPRGVFYAAAAVLGVMWIVNVHEAGSTPGTFAGSSSAVLYYNAVRLFSVVSFALMVPLWGRPAPLYRYGKWFLIIANAAAVLTIVVIAIVAEPYWEAWGCYGGHIPATLQYQRNGLCGASPVYTNINSPVCDYLSGVDSKTPGQVDSISCRERVGDILSPFRHVLKWCLHAIAITYAAYVVLTLREQTGGSLAIALKNAAVDFRDSL